MTDRIIPLGCPAPPIDQELVEATNARPDASTTRPLPDEDHVAHGWHTAAEGAHSAAFVVELAVHGGGAGAAATAGGALAMVGGYVLLIEHAYAEGERQSQEYNQQMLRGALAVFEGRMGTPEVEAEMRRNPAYADGVRRAHAMSVNIHTSDQAVAIANIVRASGRGGMLAVAEGRDHGPEFQQRYENDLAFRHGVDHMRHLRDTNPDAYARKADDLTQAAAQIDRSRCTGMRG